MKKILFLALIFINFSCVQKSYDRIVVYTLQIKGKQNIKKVGIRGNDAPLSWNEDFEMKEIVKDSLYKAIVTTKTGYLGTRVKFTVNGEFELQNQPNREIKFDTTTDTTYVSMVFDKNN